MKFFSIKESQQRPITITSAVEINEDYYYYPKNLRAKTQIGFWTLNDCIAVMSLFLVCLLLWYTTRVAFILTIPLTMLFLTARIDDKNILTRIKEAYLYIAKTKTHKNNVKPNSSQQLIGGKYIIEDGIYYTDSGRYAMWEIEPFNLSVMSPGSISIIIGQMTSLLIQCPNIEIIATDSARSLDDNIAFLKKRISEEPQPAVKKLLEADLAEMSERSAKANNSRRYLFILHFAKGSPITQDLTTCRRYSKVMQDTGFEVTQLLKPEIKKILANFFDIVSELPDYDGLQYLDDDNKGGDYFDF